MSAWIELATHLLRGEPGLRHAILLTDGKNETRPHGKSWSGAFDRGRRLPVRLPGGRRRLGGRRTRKVATDPARDLRHRARPRRAASRLHHTCCSLARQDSAGDAPGPHAAGLARSSCSSRWSPTTTSRARDRGRPPGRAVPDRRPGVTSHGSTTSVCGSRPGRSTTRPCAAAAMSPCWSTTRRPARSPGAGRLDRRCRSVDPNEPAGGRGHGRRRAGRGHRAGGRRHEVGDAQTAKTSSPRR